MLGKGLQALIPAGDDDTKDVKSEENKDVGSDLFKPKEENSEDSGHKEQLSENKIEHEIEAAGDVLNNNAVEPIIIPAETGEKSDKSVEKLPASDKPAESDKNIIEGDEPKDSVRRGQISGGAIFLVEVEKIKPNPHQPRRSFNENSLKELAASMREHGILQPLVVSKIEKDIPSGASVEYQLIAGERRLLAAKMLGMERVPVIIRQLTDNPNESLEIAIIENLQREDLNAVEMARAFARLQDEFRMTQREIATRLGKSRETVANTLRLLDLPHSMQDALIKGQITESHGRLLLTIKDPALQERLFQDLLENNITTRELHKRVKNEKKSSAVIQSGINPELLMFEEKLSSTLGAPVKINRVGDSGRITINFYSQEELKSIIENLGKTMPPD